MGVEGKGTIPLGAQVLQEIRGTHTAMIPPIRMGLLEHKVYQNIWAHIDPSKGMWAQYLRHTKFSGTSPPRRPPIGIFGVGTKPPRM